MNAKYSHTPAPWTVSGQSDGGRYITVTAACGRVVARVPFSTDAQLETVGATDASDAHLIATAPRLLSALRRVTEQLAHRHGYPMEEAWIEAYAAIAEATR